VNQPKKGLTDVRLIWTMASVGILVASTAPPAPARDYPWCQRESGVGGGISCRFATQEQCQAAASGVGGGCLQNPAMAAGQPRDVQRSSLQEAPSSDAPPRRRPYRVKHQPGKHGWYYE